MSNNNDTLRKGERFGTFLRNFVIVLTLCFCAMRACDVINWAWYWVISPVIIMEIVGIVLLIIIGAVTTNLINKSDGGY